MIAELGDVEPLLTDDDAIAQFAGLTWPARGSGQLRPEDTPLSHTATAICATIWSRRPTVWEDTAPSTPTTTPPNTPRPPSTRVERALVLTARKLVRLLDALLRTETLYQPPEQHPTPAGPGPHAQRPQRQRHQRRADAIT